MDSAQPLPTSPTRKVFWWNPHLFSFKELVRVHSCCFSFHPRTLFFFKFLTVMFYWHRFFFQRWNCIVTTHGPPPMAGHSSSVIGNTMVVFGGSLGARQMYDHAMYLYYSLKWEEWCMSAGHMSVTPRVWSFVVNLNLYLSTIVVPIRSNEVWVLDLEQWSWSKPPIAGPSPHPRGGQSQVRRVQL